MALRVGKEEKRGGYSQGLIEANNVFYTVRITWSIQWRNDEHVGSRGKWTGDVKGNVILYRSIAS